MKRLFVVTLGVLIGLSFLAPAVLSQEASYAGHNDMGTAIQSGAQSPSTTPYDLMGGEQNGSGFQSPSNTPYDLMGGEQNGTYMNQQNGPYGYWMNWLPDDSDNASAQSSGQSYPGRNGGPCVGVAGGMSC